MGQQLCLVTITVVQKTALLHHMSPSYCSMVFTISIFADGDVAAA